MPTAANNTALIQLVMGLFQASPSARIYQDLAAIVAGGVTLPELAERLAESALFASIYPSELTDDAFARLLLCDLLGLEQGYDFTAAKVHANADYRAALDFLTASTTSVGRGITVFEAVTALAQVDYYSSFGAARLRLENRTDVVEHYIASGGAANDLPALQVVIADVTASSRSVPAAIAAIDLVAGTKSGGSGTAESWTIMVYMAADNDLEPFGFLDLNEMEAATLPPGVNVVVSFDRVPGHDATNGNWTDTRVGVVVPDKDLLHIATPLTSIGEANMGDPATLTHFIDWAAQTKPADNYALILWGHGSGIDGASFDQTAGNDALTLGEIRTALAAASPGSDRLSLVGFDTCSMAIVEQAYGLYGMADYLVASQDDEPGEGWNYTTWLNAAFKKQSPPSAASIDGYALAQAAIGSYAAEYRGDQNITLSLTTIDALPTVVAALQGFVQSADAVVSSTDWAAIRSARKLADYFPDAQAVDLIGFADALAAQSSVSPGLLQAAQDLSAAVAIAVPLATTSEVGAHGLSIYWPATQPYDYAQIYSPDTIDLLDSVAWNGFLDDYWHFA